jgi:hypothetical protein
VGGTGNSLHQRNRKEERPGPDVGWSRPFEERSGGFERQRRGGIRRARPRLGRRKHIGLASVETTILRTLLGALPLVEGRTLISCKSQIPFIIPR